ncbi:MAG: hypothetical protein R3E12_19385 [Candidatus Eisenbacteria bacterium]
MARGHEVQYGLGKLEQPQEVRDGRPILSDGDGDLRVRSSELIYKPLVSPRFVDCVEVFALNVLDQRNLEAGLIADLLLQNGYFE